MRNRGYPRSLWRHAEHPRHWRLRRHAESHRPLLARRPRVLRRDARGRRSRRQLVRVLRRALRTASRPACRSRATPAIPSSWRTSARRERIDAALVGPEAEVRFWSGREFPVPTLLRLPRLVAIAISKGKLYEALRETGLVPRYRIASRDDLLERRGLDLGGRPRLAPRLLRRVFERDRLDPGVRARGGIRLGLSQSGDPELHGRRTLAGAEHRLLASLPRGRAAQGGLLRSGSSTSWDISRSRA